jgi:hypothetical protein
MKFSWSPKGLLGAALNDAKFKLGGQVSHAWTLFPSIDQGVDVILDARDQRR